MYNGFLNNSPQQKIFENKSTKIIPSMKKNIIQSNKKKRISHSFDYNEDQIAIKLNNSNINDFQLSETISVIYFPKEDFKNKYLNDKNVDISFNSRKNNDTIDNIFLHDDGSKITKKNSSNTFNSSDKIALLREELLQDNKNENDEAIQKDKDKVKIKRPNYLIKSCFFNNSELIQRNYGRSLSKKESSPSPVLDFYIYKDKNEYNNGDALKKFYKRSTFGKASNNPNIQKTFEIMNKKIAKNNLQHRKEKINKKYISHKNAMNNFLDENEESFIKIIQADSSDDENNKEFNSFIEDKNDFANEIDIINKIKDKEDTLSNLINESFKSQILEKHNNLNESMNNKNNSNIFSAQNISEGLNNSINSNRSLNEEFVFKNHSKIFQSNHHNSLSVNNSMNKNQEDKINNENISYKSKQNILNYLKTGINNKDNNDLEEDNEINHYNNINNINEIEENFNNNKNNILLNSKLDVNNFYINLNNYVNNNENMHYNHINNVFNYSQNNEINNQFFPRKNLNNLNNFNNINNNCISNQNPLNYRKNNNNNFNPYINNTINFIYNNNMNLIYNNPYNINNNDFSQQNINNNYNNNFQIYNNNSNFNQGNQFNNYNNYFSNPANQIFNNSLLNPYNNNFNINNNNLYYQNINNNNINNPINKNNIIPKTQQIYLNNNINNSNNYKTNQKMKDYTKMSNEELAKNAHILAKTQEGSRFLEKIIETDQTIASNLFFPYTLGYFEELSNNKYGNFYIKKLIKHLSKELLGKLLEFLYPMISRIGTNQYGSKIIEQLIKSIKDNDMLLAFFIQEIIPHMILLINDLNGTHIIYKILLLKSNHARIIEEHICNNIKNIYVTREGSNLLKKYFDIINKECNNTKNYEKIIYFINTINNNLLSIITDQFGNYIVRHIILNLNHSINNILIQNIIKNIIYYSNQKYSSNVVENCLDNNYVKEYIINELTNQYNFNNIFLNEYGNYVIQKAISLADDNKKDIFFKYIIQVIRQLQSLPFGPKLLSKLLMLYPKLSMYMLSIYK